MEPIDTKDTGIKAGTVLDLNFFHGNKTIETTGQVTAASGDALTIHLDTTDKNMSPPPGTDIYILKKGLLYNITDSNNFPEIKAVKVSHRNHTRVDDTLKINYTHILRDDYEKNVTDPHIIFEKAFGKYYTIPELEDLTLRTLYELLYKINAKLDYIMESLARDGIKKHTSARYEHVNISAAGMRFNTDQNFQVGDTIAFRIYLPLSTETVLDVIGQIVSVMDSETKGRNTVSVKFVNLVEDDKEIITKYVFKRQRKLLRG